MRSFSFWRREAPTTPIYLRPFVLPPAIFGFAPRLHDIETDFLITAFELGD